MTENKELSSDYGSNNLKRGQKMADGSVFAGTFDYDTRDKRNVFMTSRISYGSKSLYVASEFVKNMKDVCGHNGSSFQGAKEVYKAVQNGTYDGGWYIPSIWEWNRVLITNTSFRSKFRIHNRTYWSSSNLMPKPWNENPNHAYVMSKFSTPGRLINSAKVEKHSFCAVRNVPITDNGPKPRI